MTPLGRQPNAPPTGRRRLLRTVRGELTVETMIPATALRRLTFDAGLLSISSPQRTFNHLCKVASWQRGSVTAAWHRECLLLVGYVAIHPPDVETRWAAVPLPEVLELGSIEVSRDWRGLGLARTLLDVTFSDPWLEDKILISNEFVWHWDLEGTGLTKWKYRVMLRHILSRVGFQEMTTDEPNIRWDPANIFMVRIGREVPEEIVRRFRAWLIRGL
jgi:acetoin utilization protein AcuA